METKERMDGTDQKVHSISEYDKCCDVASWKSSHAQDESRDHKTLSEDDRGAGRFKYLEIQDLGAYVLWIDGAEWFADCG